MAWSQYEDLLLRNTGRQDQGQDSDFLAKLHHSSMQEHWDTDIYMKDIVAQTYV